MSKPSNAIKAHMLFGLLLSGLMSLLVSCVSTGRAIGLTHMAAAPGDFVSVWLQAWLASWVIAFPAVLVVAPLVRRIVNRVFAEQS